MSSGRSQWRRARVPLLVVFGALTLTYLVFIGQWGRAPMQPADDLQPASGDEGIGDDPSARTERNATGALLESPIEPASRPEGARPLASTLVHDAARSVSAAIAPEEAWAETVADEDAVPTGIAAATARPLPPEVPAPCLTPVLRDEILERVESETSSAADRAIARALVALEEGDALDALDLLEGCRAKEWGAAGLWVAGRAYLELGEAETAREHLERASLEEPDRAEIWIALARAHRRAGDARLALRAAQRALRLAGRSAAACSEEGQALLALRRADEALAAFERAVACDAAAAEAWNGIGLIQLQRERFPEARAALERAAAAEDAPAHVHNNLGLVYERLGYMEWADREYARCLEEDPAHPTAALSRERIAPFLAVRPQKR